MSAMNAASQRGSARRSDGSQSRPSATGTTPTSSPISPYPRKLRALGCGVRTAAGISSTVSIPVELVTPTAIGSSSTQAYGTTIVLERSRLERGRPVERERHDRVVDGDGRDRQVVALRVPHLDADLAVAELDAADVELVGRRRRAAEQVDDPVALRDDERDRQREQHDRDERPEPPADAPADRGRTLPRAQSSTWK